MYKSSSHHIIKGSLLPFPPIPIKHVYEIIWVKAENFAAQVSISFATVKIIGYKKIPLIFFTR
jgi:hypothetical protein